MKTVIIFCVLLFASIAMADDSEQSFCGGYAAIVDGVFIHDTVSVSREIALAKLKSISQYIFDERKVPAVEIVPVKIRWRANVTK